MSELSNGKPLSDAHVSSMVVNVDRKSRPDEGYTNIFVEVLDA